MIEIKQQLRKQVKRRLQSISEEQREDWSNQIAAQLYAQPEWKQARSIGITVSVAEEVSTYRIIEQAWREGKTVAVPKCERLSKTMTFRAIQHWDDLERVYMNLREPIVSLTNEIGADEIDLLIMPGVAFTEQGDRLGYGGGYYDRFLLAYTGQTVALAYCEQLVSFIPMEPYDQRVQKIITEAKIYNCV